VEISELSYPVHYREIKLTQNTMGAGRNRGAPGTLMTYGPSNHPMTVVFAADGQQNPARGVRGGGDGNVGRIDLIDEAGVMTQMPNVGQVELKQGQWLRGLDTAGGGYGDPLEREPSRVREDVLERFICMAHARDVYGVVLRGAVDDETLAIDEAATMAARLAMRSARGPAHAGAGLPVDA
jgi:N-methylhydantoinase B